MNGPKFKVGDRVAVFCHAEDGWTVFPDTVVDEIEETVPGDIEEFLGNFSVATEHGWHYGVCADSEHVYSERSLRCIDPDTEYLEEEQEQEKTE